MVVEAAILDGEHGLRHALRDRGQARPAAASRVRRRLIDVSTGASSDEPIARLGSPSAQRFDAVRRRGGGGGTLGGALAPLGGRLRNDTPIDRALELGGRAA